MKICQIHPGLIQIPPNGWGAVERIIWNYKTALEKLGHIVEIKYPNEVSHGQYDIVHSHMWNQTLVLADKGIPVVGHLHDHHSVMSGQDSEAYRVNAEAIDKSIITLLPGEFLNTFFNNPYKCHFFSHGVDTSHYVPGAPLSSSDKKLLIIAHNGYNFNPVADRKGFRLCVEAAKALNLPITIAGPSKNNRLFFDQNSDLLDYDRLTIKYDLNDAEALELFQTHSIFLNPSQIEAGQPNLTLLEALACGLPVVATYVGSRPLKGLRKIHTNLSSIVEGIQDVLQNYSGYASYARKTAETLDYSIIAQRLIAIYESVLNVKKNFDTVSFKNDLIHACDTTSKNNKPAKTLPDDSFTIHFIDGAFVEIKGYSDKTYSIDFINRDDNSTVYSTSLKPNCWTKTNLKYFINYEIRIKDESGKLIVRHLFNAENKNVFIAMESKALGDTLAWFPYIEEFRKQHNCNIIVSTFWNDLFKKEYPDFTFVEPGVQVGGLYAMYRLGYFDPADKFSHINDPRSTPLQKIASDILGLNYIEIKPRIARQIGDRKIKDKYVTISVNGTAQAKYWNYPGGWQSVVRYINSLGWKVVLIQKEMRTDLKDVINPEDKDIQTAINYLTFAEFHISISTGIAWLAWALDKKVIMISGITKSWNEFQSNCVHINSSEYVCNGCFNDIRFTFDNQAKGNWNVCFAHENTPRQFECTKTIKPQDVIREIMAAISV